jgi:Transposase
LRSTPGCGGWCAPSTARWWRGCRSSATAPVVALAYTAQDEVRREYWNELRAAGQTDTAKQFKADRWALLKNPDQLTPQP